MRRELIVQRDPKSPITEIFKTLRTNIQFMNANKKLKTILVTSTFPAEGKSWVSSNLAITFAQSGKKVLLVDADMRKGRQYSIFEASPVPGLSNCLSGIDENNDLQREKDITQYIQKTQIEDLYLMPAGNVPPNPSELLISSKMIETINNLKQKYDLIIIDGTPCQLLTDSVILSRIVDATVIVTAYKETKKDALEKVIKNIKNVGGNIAGVVFNKLPITQKKYNQTYYYGGNTGLTKTRKNKNRKETKKEYTNQYSKQFGEEIEDENYERHYDFFEEKPVDIEENIENNLNINKIEENNANIEEKEEVIIDRTTDILKQINAYLDKEKETLKDEGKKENT